MRAPDAGGRWDAGASWLDAGLDAAQERVPDARSASPDGAALDAGPHPTGDAGGASSDGAAGALYRSSDCERIALEGERLDGEPCDGPFVCGIYDCFCSGAWVSCSDDGELQVGGRCDSSACDVPAAYHDCARYLRDGAPPHARCDPRGFGTCRVERDGGCTGEYRCQPLDGRVFVTEAC